MKTDNRTNRVLDKVWLKTGSWVSRRHRPFLSAVVTSFHGIKSGKITWTHQVKATQLTDEELTEIAEAVLYILSFHRANWRSRHYCPKLIRSKPLFNMLLVDRLGSRNLTNRSVAQLIRKLDTVSKRNRLDRWLRYLEKELPNHERERAESIVIKIINSRANAKIEGA